MINIITSRKGYKPEELLLYNDSFFNLEVSSRDFTDLDLTIIRNIDSAEILDKNTGAIKTPRGITDIEHLSTGCKTVLNYVHLYRNRSTNKYSKIKAIDASFSGWNALEELFKTIEYTKYPIDIVLAHIDDLDMCGKREYRINNKKTLLNLGMLH